LSQDAQDALAVDLWAARRWNWEALGIPGWVETPPFPAQSEALAIGKAAREAGLAPVPGGSRKGGMILLAPMPKGNDAMYGNTPTLGLLLLIACLVAIVCRRLGQPFTIGLVLAGIGLSISGYKSGITLTPNSCSACCCPRSCSRPRCIWAGAVPPRGRPGAQPRLWRHPAVAQAWWRWHAWLAGWGWPASLLFGSLIAATDPVSVIAMMKEQHADKRLRFLMEAESLINDGAAAVLFALVAAWVAGSATSPAGIAMTLLSTVGGGVALGLAVAGAPADRRAVGGPSGRDHPDHAGGLWLLPAGRGTACLGRAGDAGGGHAGGQLGHQRRALTEVGGKAVIRFWDFAAFLANSVVFLLIGSRGQPSPSPPSGFLR
jgi:CPA1 family monovalent cation:H+ antiporter